MPNVTLTQEQIEQVIYDLAYAYTLTQADLSLNTSHDIAVETSNTAYFNGVIRGLNLVYPIPVEPPLVDPATI